MKPSDDDGGIPDDDELVAQIVPLRRRQDDSDRREQPDDESQAAAEHTDDWSVFDPPEDLQPVERAHREQHSEPDSDHVPSDQDLEHPWTSTPRRRNRLAAFAGVAVTMLAVTALVVLTLKGHAGASPRPPVVSTPNATGADRALAVHQGGSPVPRHGGPARRPSHRTSTKRSASPRKLPHTATAGTPTGEGAQRVAIRTGPSPHRPKANSHRPRRAPATSSASNRSLAERNPISGQGGVLDPPREAVDQSHGRSIVSISPSCAQDARYGIE